MLEQTLAALKSYPIPQNWQANLFLMPEQVMRDLHQFILDHNIQNCIELGTGFGATTCVMADALQQTGGKLITVEMHLPEQVNVKTLMAHVGLSEDKVEIVIDTLGYNWYLPELIAKHSEHHICTPLFDFCLLDGAHEWEPDALAFFLVDKLLKPKAWIAIDDLNFNLRMVENHREIFKGYTDRELDCFQMHNVYTLTVLQHYGFENFHVTHEGRIGWAQKKSWD